MAKVTKIVSTGVRGGFDDLKTRTKLISSYGIVSVIIIVVAISGVLTLRQLSAMSQEVYVHYTAPLANFAEMSTALTHHHQVLTGIASVTNHDDFATEVARLPSFRTKTNKAISDYGNAELRISRSGRDEAKDLALLKPAIDQYFRAADGAVSALGDSFGKNLAPAQAEHMRNLGILALTVNLQPIFEKVIEQTRNQVLDMHDVAKDLNEDAQTAGFIGTLVLVLGGLIAVVLGVAIAYWVV
ncbi:MAG: MCP four helix bundle domain-containing protein, partial [Nitrospira sp.]|nr:MCP four helix bundle domain-containing protein [Nitrospira sp.]